MARILQVRCPGLKCREMSEVPADRWRVGPEPVCGFCGLPLPDPDARVTLTAEMIHAGGAGPMRSGFNKRQVEALGLTWPPRKGWIDMLVGMSFRRETYEAFLAAKTKPGDPDATPGLFDEVSAKPAADQSPPPQSPSPKPAVSAAEAAVLDHVNKALELFDAIPGVHPDHAGAFARGCGLLRSLVAYRLAHRVAPDAFP